MLVRKRLKQKHLDSVFKRKRAELISVERYKLFTS